MPESKYLECLLYLRLGYTAQVVAEMTKTNRNTVIRYLKSYPKKGLPVKKKYIQKNYQEPIRFESILPRQGSDIFLKFFYCPLKRRKPWQMMWLVYLKTVLFPRDHNVVSKEIIEEMGLSKSDVQVILTAYREGKLYDPFAGDENG